MHSEPQRNKSIDTQAPPSPTSPSPTAPAETRPLSVRGGSLVRDEFTEDHDGRTTTVDWGHARKLLEADVRGKRDMTQVFTSDSGETVTSDVSSRWFRDQCRERYATLRENERATTARMTDPYTVMITLTGRTRNQSGGFRAPVDHFEDLRESERAVKAKLRRSFGNRDAEYIWTYGGHDSGHAHVHIGLIVDGQPDDETLRGIVDTHVRNCPIADENEHAYRDVISVRNHREKTRGMESDAGFNTSLSSYLGSQMAAVDETITDASEAKQRFATILHATDARQFATSQTFGDESMTDDTTDEDDESNEDTEWTYAGVKIDGELHEPTDGGGGIDMVETERHPQAQSIDPVAYEGDDQ